MARKAAWPPPMRLHKASGRARVTVKGVDYYLGPYGSEEAKQAYAELISKLANHQDAQPVQVGSLTVAAAVNRWFGEESARCSVKELNHFENATAVLVSVSGTTRTDKFGVADLERVRRKMIEMDWSRNVINRQVVRLRTVWRWLERQAIAPRGSWEHLRTLPGIPRHDSRVKQTKPVQPVSWLDLCRVCRQARKPVRAMLLLEWYTGARPSEICRMRPCDIDRTDGECWLYRPATHKCAWRGQDRVIPLGPICQRILSPWLEDCRNEAYIFTPSLRCPKRKRRHYTAESYAQVIRRAAEKAGVEGFHAYRTRHSYRVRVTRELGLDHARAAMGHSSIGTTNSYAAGVDLETAKKVARKLG